MNFTTIVLKFESDKETFKQAYEIHLKDLKDSVMAVDNGNDVALHMIRLELCEMIAVVENKQAQVYGLTLNHEMETGI